MFFNKYFLNTATFKVAFSRLSGASEVKGALFLLRTNNEPKRKVN